MKIVIYAFFLASALALWGQEELAPEPSEAPFKIGELPLQSGYIIERKDAPDLNFRIVNDRMRLYWLDENGLIMEPTVPEVSVRFDDRGLRETIRTFFRIDRVSDDIALGSPYILPVPHRYYVTILIQPPNSDDFESYRFRYLPAMDKVVPLETK